MEERTVWLERLRETAPRVHCLTNPVTMGDVANVLLAAGGSAIMAQEASEVQEITGLCDATLLNMGVPDEDKLCACMLAGEKAVELGHPVVLDPVGVGASEFRRKGMERLLKKVKPSLVRCNQEEACALLHLQSGISGGVESGVHMGEKRQMELAKMLAEKLDCAVLVSGKADAVSDGEEAALLTGGDQRAARITGSGCMLSALCALFCGAGLSPLDAALAAGGLWKESARIAGEQADRNGGGIGSFRVYLFDALDRICHEGG